MLIQLNFLGNIFILLETVNKRRTEWLKLNRVTDNYGYLELIGNKSAHSSGSGNLTLER